MVAFLRGIILFFTWLLLSISGSVILIKYLGWLVGIPACLILFIILACVSIAVQNKIPDGKISNFDIMLPLIISLFSTACFWPIRFIKAELFSSAACFMSGVFLSMAFYKLKNEMIRTSAVVVIFCTFLYEITPISLPTDLDDILAFGASTVALLFGRKNVSKILEIQDNPRKRIE